MQVGTLGHIAFVVDPAGASVGAWQPLDHQGFAARWEVGAPAWFETLSADYEKSCAFYRDAFDWELATMSDTHEFRYTTLGEGQGAMAGIMDATGVRFAVMGPSTPTEMTPDHQGQMGHRSHTLEPS